MRTSIKVPLFVLILAVIISISPQAMAQRFLIFGLTNQVWKYDSTNDWYTPTGTGWTASGFDDSAWPSGRALLSSDPNVLIVALRGTVIRDLRNPLPGVPGSTANQAVYFRTHFNWPSNASPAAQLILTCRIDDGCAVYLNGNRVGGLRMAASGLQHNSFTENAALVPCQDPNGNNDATCDEVIMVDGTFLQNGDNVLAVSGHQNNPTSSDLTWGCQLEGVMPFAPRIVDPTQPTNRVVVQSRPTTLIVVADASPAPTYLWHKDGSPMNPIANPTVTNSSLIISNMSAGDAGGYFCLVSNLLGMTNSRTAIVGYMADMAAPIPLYAVGSPTFDRIYIQFDEQLDSGTATDPANYSISPALSLVGDPILANSGHAVILTTAAQTEGATYTVTMTDVHDFALNPIAAPNNTVQFRAWVPTRCGDLFFEVYNGTPGPIQIGLIASTAVSVLTNHPTFPNSPSERLFLSTFSTIPVYPSGPAHDNFGGRIRGLFFPPESGNWKFYLRGDDGAEIWFNPNGPSASGRTRIAQQPGFVDGAFAETTPGTRTSAPIPLAANQAYYIEALYQENIGGDYVEVAAKLETDPTPAASLTPIPGSMLGVGFAPPDVLGPVSIVQQPASRTNEANTQATFTVVASNTMNATICYQWQRSDDGGANFTDIPGATGASYITPYLTEADDNGDAYRVLVSVIGSSATSATATLAVTPDVTRPRVTRVLGINNTNIAVIFTEPMTGPMSTALDPTAYAIDNDPNVQIGEVVTNSTNPLRLDIFLSPAGFPMTLGTVYRLRVSTASQGGTQVQDGSGNLIDPDPTIVEFRAQNFPGDANNLRELPTTGMLPLGALTNRGFAGRLVQVGVVKPNGNETTESVLAGTFTNTVTGQLALNIAPLPVFFETNIINYNRFAPTGAAIGRLGSPESNFPGYTVSTPNMDSMTMELFAYLQLERGIYRFGVDSDDGFRLSPATSVIDPNNSFTVGEFNGGRGGALPGGETLFDFYVSQDGLYPFRLIWEQGTSGADLEWYEQDLNTTTPTFIAINAPAPAGGIASPGGGGPPAFTPPCTAKNLAASLSGTNLVVTWPIAGGGNLFELQSTPSLSSPIAWSFVPQIPQNAAGNKRVTIPITAGQNRFYQLYKAAPPNCP